MQFYVCSMWLGCRKRSAWDFMKISLNSVPVAAVPAQSAPGTAGSHHCGITRASGTSPKYPSAVTAVVDVLKVNQHSKILYITTCKCTSLFSST